MPRDLPDAAEPVPSALAEPVPVAASDTFDTARHALPDKAHFKIGEVAAIVGVEPYVLRYWESEFKRDIRPDRNRANQRVYRKKDVETFLEIKRLRYDEKLELPGARKKLRGPRAVEAAVPVATAGASSESAATQDPASRASAGRPEPGAIAALKKGLRALLDLVDEDEKRG